MNVQYKDYLEKIWFYIKQKSYTRALLVDKTQLFS